MPITERYLQLLKISYSRFVFVKFYQFSAFSTIFLHSWGNDFLMINNLKNNLIFEKMAFSQEKYFLSPAFVT